ncbi:MAG TPA: hypothetical protein VHS06_02755 [Chloroflexota bacterium]|nr:hypothetical protein [Chloroflexota bacterium]
MRELDRRIAALRLRLAEINSRHEQLQTLQKQFQNQISSIVDFAALENRDLSSVLSMAEEVDTRLRQTEQTLRLLEAIRARGEEELETLLLTRTVDNTKAELAERANQLQHVRDEIARIEGTGIAQPIPDSGEESEMQRLRSRQAEIEAEIQRLHDRIDEASEAAARAVSDRGHRGIGEERGP